MAAQQARVHHRAGRIDPTNLTRAFTTLLRKAGLRRIRFHDLRHSTATLLLEQGVELVAIKELLGHAPHRRHRHRLRPRQTPPPTRRHRPPRPRPAQTAGQPDDGDYPPPCAAPAR
ncbi:tyrosine-type recombinase/integrase [Streptomyces sp. NPDC059568]|uniref:tyrosine-type recombinase/integrase n=1 Tax=Streptomyces sp. NPDC059568 TaxID=3346868 RepID=UPI0036B00A1B